MAVTKSSDDNLESPVERSKPSCGEVADPGTRVLLHLNKPNVTSTGQPYINKDNSGFIKRCMRRRYRTETDASDNFSDIDDAEVIGYLNTKKEMNYKRIIWEAMNGEFVNAKKQKRAPAKSKGVPLKNTGRTTEKVELQRPSSRINYDALKILYNEVEQGSESTQIITADSSTHKNKVFPNENIKSKVRGSNESYYKDFQPESSYCKDKETSDGHNDLCDEYGEEHFNDDYFDFE